ncbi:CDP-glycerol glycerophosphotransferase family protein [Erysipelotrichaceae bacterium OttesenSCG-928-M19]|nr:CDP-glycerol glycerophosphotransferase family protein [Erysipelotrichaceae bacterium OttesenSCG-928-M19]
MLKKIIRKLILFRYRKYDNKELEKKLFVAKPKTYELVSRARRTGQRKEYRKNITKKVNEKMFFFESNLGRQYTGNPRYIYEAMIEMYPDYEYVWGYNGDPDNIPGNPKVVERGSQEYYQLLAQAKYLINNTNFLNIFFRKESFFLQTWHGTPLKTLHYDRKNIEPARREKGTFYLKSREWSALLAANEYSASKFKSAFRYEGEILEYGYPANDVFYDSDKQELFRRRIREQLNIEEDKYVILYAPTWTGYKPLGGAIFEFKLELDIEKLISDLGNDVVLLIRSHHMSASDEVLEKLKGQIINVSKFDDAIELMCAADLLITDYSSIIYDWYCTKKPALYYVPDLEEFLKYRPLYYDFRNKYSIPLCQSQDELVSEINNALQGNHVVDEQFYQDFCSLHDGNATKKVIEYLLSK